MSKGKDPAFLFYWNDWYGGTSILTRHQKGCYMDLLHAQFNHGHLSLEEVKTVLGSDFSVWGALQKKFKTDEKGLFFNERMELEKHNRKKFTESRRENLKGKKSSHTGSHMENESEIDIWVNGFKLLKEDEKWFTETILMKTTLPEEELNLCLEQFWLSLQKSNFKGQLKQIRAAFVKWHNTWQGRKKESIQTGQTKQSTKFQNLISVNAEVQKRFENVSED